MSVRDVTPSAYRPAQRSLCVVMVCTDMSEADQLGRQLLELNNVRLVTYRRMEDLVFNAPTGKVTLVVLASCEEPAALTAMLKWLRNAWPRCPVLVVGDEGCGERERLARAGGAGFMVRPVTVDQWQAALEPVARHAAEETSVGSLAVTPRQKPFNAMI